MRRVSLLGTGSTGSKRGEMWTAVMVDLSTVDLSLPVWRMAVLPQAAGRQEKPPLTSWWTAALLRASHVGSWTDCWRSSTAASVTRLCGVSRLSARAWRPARPASAGAWRQTAGRLLTLTLASAS